MGNQDCKLQWYRITYKQLCFAVGVHPGGMATEPFVQYAAPVGKWMLGKTWITKCGYYDKSLSNYWLRRGATIGELNH
jgi:hypothetical protein